MALIHSFSGCSQLGENPSGAHLDELRSLQTIPLRMRGSKIVEKIFLKKCGRESFWKNPMKRFSNNMLFNPNQTVPEIVLPEIRPPDLKEFLKPTGSIKFVWFGHSTLLINIQNTIILVDPVFSPSASPVNFIVPRFQPPVLELNELPKIDVVLISHDHYDHLDMNTVQYLSNKVSKFIVPLGVTSHLKSWGVSEEKMVELDWWESTSFDQVTFTSTPAQHFSGRQASSISLKHFGLLGLFSQQMSAFTSVEIQGMTSTTNKLETNLDPLIWYLLIVGNTTCGGGKCIIYLKKQCRLRLISRGVIWFLFIGVCLILQSTIGMTRFKKASSFLKKIT